MILVCLSFPRSTGATAYTVWGARSVLRNFHGDERASLRCDCLEHVDSSPICELISRREQPPEGNCDALGPHAYPSGATHRLSHSVASASSPSCKTPCQHPHATPPTPLSVSPSCLARLAVVRRAPFGSLSLLRAHCHDDSALHAEGVQGVCRLVFYLFLRRSTTLIAAAARQLCIFSIGRRWVAWATWGRLLRGLGLMYNV